MHSMESASHLLQSVFAVVILYKLNDICTKLSDLTLITGKVESHTDLFAATAPQQRNDDHEGFLHLKAFASASDAFACDVCTHTPSTYSEKSSMKHIISKLDSSSVPLMIVSDTRGDVVGILESSDVVIFCLQGCPEHKMVCELLRRGVVCDVKTSVLTVLEVMKSGTRYVAVDRHGIITQRSLANFMRSNIPSVERVMMSSVSELHLIKKGELVVCRDNEPARRAFERMVIMDVTSVPVLNANDEVVAVISASDVFHSCGFSERLNVNVMEFLREHRECHGGRSPSCVVSCRSTDSLTTIMDLMDVEHVHHVYVIGCDQHAVGVVSYVDILNVFHCHLKLMGS